MIVVGTKAFGRIDYLLDSAGSAGRRSSFIDQAYALNVDSVFYTMQSLLPHIIDNGYGVIANTASMAHRRGGPQHSVHYASAKGAVLTLTMGVGRKFVNPGIRALSVSPGPLIQNSNPYLRPNLKSE